MTASLKLKLEKWLGRHPHIEDILGFFVGIGIITLLPFEWLKDKIHDYVVE